MPQVFRVSGTKVSTPQTPYSVQSGGNINLISTTTNILGDANIALGLYVTGKGTISSDQNVQNPYGIPYNPNDKYGSQSQREGAALYVKGGVGIEKDLNVGGFIYGRITYANTSLQLVVTSTNVDSFFYPTFVQQLDTAGQYMWGDSTGVDGGLKYNPAQGKLVVDRVKVAQTDEDLATNSNNALYVAGGAWVDKSLVVGKAVLPDANLGTDNKIGNTSTQWAEGYIQNLYSKLISSTTGTVKIDPYAGLTEIIGDIRVTGDRPIGTAPVVTNILYVTMDGDDTNDGRAMDPSRACRTITGAVASPYYQSGTQIRVAPGHYLEDNPIQLKPYTSIMGSDIRTTGIEPINKTQDLFHMNSGCYLAFMQFLNGRSGLLEGPYAEGYNRGAYCTAFPPLTGDDRIDLYHSPYIQNCTNLSGPWLKDGTLFTPNQTVQVPVAVGTGTWAANTTTITVVASTGTIVRGMAVNAGQQNPGFFNARTLMLANKPFLQEQVVKYVNEQVALNASTPLSIWYGFTYNQEFCFRDVGILVENVAYDAAFGGNEKSVDSGKAYYRGVVSLIAGQEKQTTAAINYLNSLTTKIVANTTVPDLFSNGITTTATYSQVKNIVLTGGGISTSSINSLFSTITNIINSGTSVSPTVYKSTGPDAAFVSAEILMQANRKFIQEDTINYINWNLINFTGNINPLRYSERKCRRDTGLILDSVAFDLLYPTAEYSQSTFAGRQYWNAGGSSIPNEVSTTTAAIQYLKDLSIKIIQNITPADDLVQRFQTGTNQVTNLQPGSSREVDIVRDNFNLIIEVISGNTSAGWTDRIVANSTTTSALLDVQQAVALLQANKAYMKAEVSAYIQASTASGGLGFSTIYYDDAKCRRDIGYMIDCVSFDLSRGGNRQSIQAGLYYYSPSLTSSVIYNETTATIAAFNYLGTIAGQIIQNNIVTRYNNKYAQNISWPASNSATAVLISRAISTVTNIIQNGPNVANSGVPIAMTATNSAAIINAFNILYANKDFIKEEVISYIDRTYNDGAFNYNEELCYRDTGLIVDAVSQDILLGGNSKSVEAGLAYWNQGYNYVTGQETTTTMAINHARDIALKIIANQVVTPQTGTVATQVINPFFQYGGDYMPQQAVRRNFDIVTNIIQNGPNYAPPVYQGGGVTALTGINGLDVLLAPRVVSVTTVTTGTYVVGLNTATIGFGNNATLYFGDTLVFPKQNIEVENLSLEYTGNRTTWNHRKVDPIGGMGGSLVDGAVISDRSPIQSFVYDAFTQLTQGGHGVKITNNGYAQLVSVFTIFSSVGVQVTNGGIASIVNSNANFGDVCLLAKGFGSRKFSGTVYNPPFKAYPDSPDPVTGLNQYYPNGFWPNGARVQVFIPDQADRPHISLVMEVEPPIGHVNEQAFPGFLNAQPSIATLTTGSLVIDNIDNTGVAIGNYLYIRDQFGSTTGTDGVSYIATGTVVTDLGYRSVTLSNALTSGGGDVNNDKFFNLYFCGNAYYTVLSSTTATNPKPDQINILSAAGTGVVDQIAAHVDSLLYLNTLTTAIINNSPVPGPLQSTSTQAFRPFVTGGGNASTFINLRFGDMIHILEDAATSDEASSFYPPKLRTKSGPAVLGGGSAVTMIELNMDFMADEISEYVSINYPGIFSSSGYNADKCKRDVKLILQRLIYDIQSGGRYNSVMIGLSYWSRSGTHFLVDLGENVRRTDLFPDGANVNFYQRSYISASGYVFEYVGAGTNYGALPQFGIADPVQGKETVQLGSGKVFFTSTDQNGDFRIGPGLVISQATGVLSGRTFTKSLFANMTPFILAIEGGAI